MKWKYAETKKREGEKYRRDDNKKGTISRKAAKKTQRKIEQGVTSNVKKKSRLHAGKEAKRNIKNTNPATKNTRKTPGTATHVQGWGPRKKN